jgi:hypothetical protein
MKAINKNISPHNFKWYPESPFKKAVIPTLQSYKTPSGHKGGQMYSSSDVNRGTSQFQHESLFLFEEFNSLFIAFAAPSELGQRGGVIKLSVAP